jgi:non-specific serine/threonine protein kinase
VLEHWTRVQREAGSDGVSFLEGMRLLSGTAAVDADAGALADDGEWSRVEAGAWLAETLAGLRGPVALADADPGADLRGALRPYQRIGVSWLRLASSLRLGVCLADDMGLGKTIQVLGLLLLHKRQRQQSDPPHLLVVPASLLSNWQAELERFAPSLVAVVAHPSALSAQELADLGAAALTSVDLVITTYGTLVRSEPLRARAWWLAILDEAQAIKNPGTRQTRAVKALRARARVALTGTPVENRLGDLWSIFDFLDPGLLGSAKEFAAFVKRLAERPEEPYAPLRRLVQPYVLRRLKTDRAIVADLPDKTEVKAYCPLSGVQAALYQQAVAELEHAIVTERQGMKRRGLILAYLMRFKQICNHPSHWLGDGRWDEESSGKLARLREIVEAVAATNDKVLVFTQFREATEPLAAFLADVFGRPGLILHGTTPVQERGALVKRFQDDPAVPFFVLSLKAGGVGLNLTAASHVVHFDRWWNPAVEDQATDRAYRIGQHRNVLVHKLICRGTVEERIDRLIEDKHSLARGVLVGAAETLLTEMSNEELMALVTLDLSRATIEA